MCNESNSEAWQGKWINELTCSNLLCSFLYCTHTGNSILNCYALACYSVTSTWENELPQFLHSTRSHNKSTFVWKVVSCLGIVLEETNCTVYWKKTTKSMTSFVTALSWMYWNEQLLGDWFYMLLKLSYNNQYALCFPLYSMYCSRGMIVEKRMMAFLYFSILMESKVWVTPGFWVQTPYWPFA